MATSTYAQTGASWRFRIKLRDSSRFKSRPDIKLLLRQFVPCFGPTDDLIVATALLPELNYYGKCCNATLKNNAARRLYILGSPRFWCDNFRPPDIGHRENVRFPCISGCGSGGRGRGAAMGRRAGDGEADARWRANREAHAQARAREDRRRVIEELAQCLRGARSMRRAERCQRDVQLAVADADVAGGGEQLMQERASLLFGTGVVKPQQREQIALGLIGDHLDDVRQVFALGGEFDHGTLTEVSDLGALGNVAAFVDEPGQAVTCGAQLLAEFAVGDLEAAHRGAALLGVVGRGGAVVAFDLGEFDAGGADLLVQRTALGVGNRTGRIFRFDPIVHERIEQELFAHVLEEVLLSPAIEHAVGHLDVTQIRSIRDHLGLMAVVAQACDLPQAQLALEEADRLVMQVVAHPAPIELGAAVDEAPLVDETALPLR